MESFDITRLFNLLDPEKQKFLLSELLAKQPQDQATEEQTTSESVSDKSESEGVRFTADELLEKVRAGNKETEAQKYFKFLLKEAAKRAGIWDKALPFSRISGGKWNSFNQLVIDFCPQLKNRLHDVKKCLSTSLINRRNYLLRVGKLQKGQKEIKTDEPAVKEPGGLDLVKIMFKGKCLGTGVIIKQENEMFSRVLLKSKYLNTGLGEVSLPETTDGKTKFDELKVGTEFLWKSERLIVASTKAMAKSPPKEGKNKKRAQKKKSKTSRLSVDQAHSPTPSTSTSSMSFSSPSTGHSSTLPSSTPSTSTSSMSFSSPSTVHSSTLPSSSTFVTQSSQHNTPPPSVTPSNYRGWVNVPVDKFVPKDIFLTMPCSGKRAKKAKKQFDI